MAGVKYETAADWLHDLGDVPLERIIMDPWPGTATEKHLLVFVERGKRLCELVDGTLVEKPVGYLESLIAGWLITELNNFIGPRSLGFVSGEAGMIRMISGRVRCRMSHSSASRICREESCRSIPFHLFLPRSPLKFLAKHESGDTAKTERVF